MHIDPDVTELIAAHIAATNAPDGSPEEMRALWRRDAILRKLDRNEVRTVVSAIGRLCDG